MICPKDMRLCSTDGGCVYPCQAPAVLQTPKVKTGPYIVGATIGFLLGVLCAFQMGHLCG